MKIWAGIEGGNVRQNDLCVVMSVRMRVTFLWECSAYSSTRASFMKKLLELLEDDYEDCRAGASGRAGRALALPLL